MKTQQKPFYEVIKSSLEDWDNLYYGQNKQEAERIAKEASYDYSVLIEVFDPEWDSLRKEWLPADDRKDLLQVYKGEIESIQ